MTQASGSRKPNVEWVRDVLGRNILTAAQDVHVAASWQYAGDLTNSKADFAHTFMVASTKWAITHLRAYCDDRVDGFQLTITCMAAAAPDPDHLEFCQQHLELAGYQHIQVSDTQVIGFLPVDEPFVPLAYA